MYQGTTHGQRAILAHKFKMMVQQIQSGFSELLSFTYNIDKQLLKVCFISGLVLCYLDVPSTIYFSLVHAYSPEGYFEKNIKPVFSSVKVDQ
jgi:hypothetical protein